jgi:D-glycero-D-manno-heptose 1,7-bisphosphate phosphatase
MPGLGLQAAAELGIDLSRSFVLGDKPADVAWGQRLGATSFLVRTGHGASVDLARLPRPTRAVDDLLHAAEFVQRRISSNGGGRWNGS